MSADEIFSISQISPKSDTLNLDERDDTVGYETSANLDMVQIQASTQLRQLEDVQLAEADQPSPPHEHNHVRVERSALPALNEYASAPSLSNQRELRHLEGNDVDSSGRYFEYISPTKIDEDSRNSVGEMTQIHRAGKDLNGEHHFLERGDLRLMNLSRSLISPTSATQMIPIATIVQNNARQNPNPDIQDIITGIVKLLNGNVNVHANTQASRRPIATRINNRGPPRISESQPLPGDYEASLTPPTTSNRPPYPFDRPEGPIRPFLTGVPLPEQIVPSMQQNYRPGFVSQNRPPWQRPRPRPPISSNRRPIPPYKPNPPMPEYRPEDDVSLTTIDTDANPTYDLNSHEEDLNNSYGIDDVIVENPSTEIPVKKDEITKKKDKIPPKVSEKRPLPHLTQSIPIFNPMPTAAPPPIVSTSESTTTTTETTTPTTTTTTEPTTTPQPSTESKPEAQLQDTLTTENEHSSLQSSIDDIGSILVSSVSETPTLSTAQITNTAQFGFPTEQSSSLLVPTKSSTINSDGLASTSGQFYHPRPGIVLDDPEFKPGGNNQRPQSPPQRPRPPIQASRPHPGLPGYGEIFDITLSAIQGPGSGSGSKQTVNIKPYGAYPVTGNDILLAPSGDQGFVSIDGKRTYINLFGEQTDAPPSPIPSLTTVQPTKVAQVPPITGTGYAVVETELPDPPIRTPQPARPHHHRPTRPTQPPVR